MVGDWLAWEPCSVSCGSGTAERKRSIKQQPARWEIAEIERGLVGELVIHVHSYMHACMDACVRACVATYIYAGRHTRGQTRP